jgi:signal transduction histidine kinase
LEEISVRGRIIAANSTAALAFANVADAHEILSALGADPHIVAAALYDGAGKLFAAYPADLPERSLPAAPETSGYRFQDGLLIGFQPVAEVQSQRLGTLYLASDLGALYATLRLSGLIGLAVTAFSLLAAYVFSEFLQKAISTPVLRLAETARAVSSREDYSVRAPEVGGDELGALTTAFNHMLTHIEDQDRAVRESKQEVQLYAEQLEERVAKRTRELEASNEALQQTAAELRSSNHELDAFAYSVSHDLRAPLRSIDGFSQVLLEDYGGELDDDARDALRRVRAASQRMSRLIDDLLKLARLNRAEMRTQLVDLSRIASEITDELRETAPGRQVSVDVSSKLEARGDPDLLQVVLDNLLRNSWKYTSRTTNPHIEFTSVEVDGRPVFVVRDNGAGFDMKYADKLFGVFQRLHKAEEFEGTGVGLATVQRIISRHGGKIWAEGAVGEGAAFYFTL